MSLVDHQPLLTIKHEYDAWNRLVTVKTQEDNLTIATYKYDALGRRMKKVGEA